MIYDENIKTFEDWQRVNNILLKKMDEWRKTYVCPENCPEWKKWKFCEHLRKARGQRFGEDIDLAMEELVRLNYGDPEK